MHEPLSRSRSANPTDTGFLSFLDPMLQPGLAWMLYGVREDAERADERDDSGPQMTLEVFIPPDKTYRHPFPIDTQEMLHIARQTPGAAVRFVVVGEDSTEPSAGERAKTAIKPAAEPAADIAAYSFPPGRYGIESTLVFPEKKAGAERESKTC